MKTIESIDSDGIIDEINWKARSVHGDAAYSRDTWPQSNSEASRFLANCATCRVGFIMLQPCYEWTLELVNIIIITTTWFSTKSVTRHESLASVTCQWNPIFRLNKNVRFRDGIQWQDTAPCIPCARYSKQNSAWKFRVHQITRLEIIRKKRFFSDNRCNLKLYFISRLILTTFFLNCHKKYQFVMLFCFFNYT